MKIGCQIVKVYFFWCQIGNFLNKDMHGPITKKKGKKSFLPALLARLQRTCSLTDRPVLFLSCFSAMEIAAAPLSRCLCDGDAARHRISCCLSLQQGSSNFISLVHQPVLLHGLIIINSRMRLIIIIIYLTSFSSRKHIKYKSNKPCKLQSGPPDQYSIYI